MVASDALTALDLLIGSATLVAIALLAYHHAGYPLILRYAGRRASAVPPAVPDDALPRITVIVPAYNEAAVIAAKIENLRTLDYPADRLDVIIACDGCSDATAGVASAAAALEPVLDADIRDFPDNRGKVAVLNDVLGGPLGDLVCLTDASALLNPDALRIAAAHFADPRVGVVAGTYRFAETGTEGEAACSGRWPMTRSTTISSCPCRSPPKATGASTSGASSRPSWKSPACRRTSAAAAASPPATCSR